MKVSGSQKAVWKAEGQETWYGTVCGWLCGLGESLNLTGLSFLICKITGWIKPFTVLQIPSVS